MGCVEDRLRSDLVGDEGGEIGEEGHAGKLQDRPLPGVGFALDDGQGAHALHGEEVEDEQRERGGKPEGGLAGVQIGLLRHAFPQSVLIRVAANGVNRGHGADEDLTGGEGGQERDPDFPVVTEGFYDGFHGLADVAGVGVFQTQGGDILCGIVLRNVAGFNSGQGFCLGALHGVSRPVGSKNP